MRTIGLGLALAASAQLMLLSSPAMADTPPAANSTPPPAADSTAPAANSTPPAANSTPPATNSTPPAANSTAPAASSTAPAPSSTLPAADSTPPAAESPKARTGFEASQPPPPKDSSKAKTGWILLGSGGALAIGGIVVDAIGAGQTHISGQGAAGDTATTQHGQTDLLFAGTTMIIVGVVAGIYGGSLILESKKSSQDLATTAPPPALGSADPVTKAAQASLAGAPTVVVPVLGARF